MSSPIPPVRVVITAGDDGSVAAAMRELVTQLKVVEGQARRTQGAVNPMTAAMSRSAAGSERFAQGLRVLASQKARVGSAATGAVPGLKKFSTAAANLSLGMVGLTGTTGRLAEGLLLMGLGGVVTLSVVAGIALIAGAYRLLTKDTREARKATDDFIAAQVKAAQARRDAADPSLPVERAFAGGTEAGEGITRRLARLNEELTKARRGVDVFDRSTGGIRNIVDEGKVKRLEEEIRGVADAAANVGRTFLDTQAPTTAQAAAFDTVAASATVAETAVTFLTTAERGLLALAPQFNAVIAAAQAGPPLPQGRTGGFEALVASQQAPFGDVRVELPTITGGIQALTDASVEAIDATEHLGESLRNAVAGNLAEFFSRGITEAEHFGQAVSELGRTILRTISAIVAQLLAAQIVRGLGGLLGGGIPSAAGIPAPVGLASGGYVSGPGTSTSDSIPARLSAGEYVVTAAATRTFRAELDAMNYGWRPLTMPQFRPGNYATGGLVSGGGMPNGHVLVELGEGLDGRITGGEFVELAHRNRRALRKALG